MHEFPPIGSTKDLAAFTRSPESTVRHWRATGQGPAHFKVGKRVLYRREDVLAWIDSQVSESTPASA